MTRIEHRPFLGEMTARATHDLKNHLAIINENAGLMDDLASLAESRGTLLDPTRVKGVAKKVMDHVHRADLLVKTLNKVVHGMDNGQTDLYHSLESMVALAARTLGKKNIQIKMPAEAPGSVLLSKTPLGICEIIWQALEFAMAHQPKEIEISMENAPKNPIIWFTLRGTQQNEELPSPNAQPMEELGVHFKKTNEGFGLIWSTPL